MFEFSKRVNDLTTSPINQYYEYVESMEKKGTRFYKLNMIQPDIKTDISYFKALKKLKFSVNGYTDSKGIFELRNSYAKYCNEKSNKSLYNFDDIIVTNGASEAIIKTLLSICNEEDEIILLEPFFSDYLLYTKLFNIKAKSLSYDNINKRDIEKLITKKTKCILFSNPNNPDGNILSKKDINIIMSVSKKYNIFVISDEVYNELYYEEFNSLLEYGDNNRIIVIDSVSKKFCNCGARIGFIVSKNVNFIKKIYFINDCKISISNSEQLAITQMLKKRTKIFKTIKHIYEKKYTKLCVN